MTPLFIQIDEDSYVNASLIAFVQDKNSGITMAYETGRENPAAYKLPFKAKEWVARVDNALALMQMVERAAT
jgi:hypothetical protein